MTYLWMMARSGMAHALDEDVPLAGGRGVGACGRPARIDVLDEREDPKCSGCVYVVSDICGSYKGYQKHRRRKTEPCKACRAANVAHTQDKRATNPRVRHGENVLLSARRRAYRRLAAEHPDRFRELLAEERAR